MDGYDTIRQYFENGEDNKGLEGVTWGAEGKTVFAVKEGLPGLLLAIDGSLTKILGRRLLSGENGFCDDDVQGTKLDFSGIAYDDSRNCLWIVSDKGQRLFMYSWDEDAVLQSFALGYEKKGKYKEVDKAEGVAIDPATGNLYVVSDKEARLYLFDVR